MSTINPCLPPRPPNPPLINTRVYPSETDIRLVQSENVQSRIDHSTDVQSRIDHSKNVQSRIDHLTNVQSEIDHSMNVQSRIDHLTNVQSRIDHSMNVPDVLQIIPTHYIITLPMVHSDPDSQAMDTSTSADTSTSTSTSTDADADTITDTSTTTDANANANAYTPYVETSANIRFKLETSQSPTWLACILCTKKYIDNRFQLNCCKKYTCFQCIATWFIHYGKKCPFCNIVKHENDQDIERLIALLSQNPKQMELLSRSVPSRRINTNPLLPQTSGGVRTNRNIVTNNDIIALVQAMHSHPTQTIQVNSMISGNNRSNFKLIFLRVVLYITILCLFLCVIIGFICCYFYCRF